MKHRRYRRARDHPKKLLTGIGGYVQYVLIAVLIVFVIGVVSNLIYTANSELPAIIEKIPDSNDTNDTGINTPWINLWEIVGW